MPEKTRRFGGMFFGFLIGAVVMFLGLRYTGLSELIGGTAGRFKLQPHPQNSTQLQPYAQNAVLLLDTANGETWFFPGDTGGWQPIPGGPQKPPVLFPLH